MVERQTLEDLGYLDKGWELDGGGWLLCPCGYRIKDYDGECPNGHKRPIELLE